jgi:hypothetical protein
MGERRHRSVEGSRNPRMVTQMHEQWLPEGAFEGRLA